MKIISSHIFSTLKFQNLLETEIKHKKVYVYSRKNSKSLQAMERVLKEKHSTIAAIIIEPILQGAGGMRIYHKDYSNHPH